MLLVGSWPVKNITSKLTGAKSTLIAATQARALPYSTRRGTPPASPRWNASRQDVHPHTKQKIAEAASVPL